MTRSLKTISINFPFKNQAVQSEATLATPKALFDFDLVVIRPYSFLGKLNERRQEGPFQVNWADFSKVKKEISEKIEDLIRLFHQGGLLVVILDALEILEVKIGGYSVREIHTVTNYHFLDDQFFRCVRNGIGDRVEYVDPSDPFTKAVKASTVRWTAFMSDRPPSPFHDVSIFARNGARSFVGASAQLGAGNIIFLPNFVDLNESEFFEACSEYRFARAGTPSPSWMPSVFLPGEREAEAAISRVDVHIQQLHVRRQEELNRRDELLSFKKLLYEKGKHQLEPVVRKALDIIGFQTSPSENIRGTPYEIDGRTKQGSSPGILEIKGSKNQISFDEFSPFVTKILADYQNKKAPSKGILIANGLCAEPPAGRLKDKMFSAHVLDAAQRNSVALVTSLDLYSVVCAVLRGEISDLATVREKILTSNGYADLSAFSPKSPFVAG